MIINGREFEGNIFTSESIIVSVINVFYLKLFK